MVKMKKNGCVGRISKKTANAIRLLLENEKSRGGFRKHKLMKGVSIKKLNRRHIPSEIMLKIVSCGEHVKSFFVVKASCSIPVHLHDKAGEMYVGGDGGIVTWINPAQKQAEEYIMRPDRFMIVDVGESHGVTLCAPMMEVVFLGIKFEEKMI
jgi:hypothetical protein